jgi:hypothetical protein
MLLLLHLMRSVSACCIGSSHLLLLLLLFCYQVKKLVYVKDVEDITAVPYVARELMLIKVRHGPSSLCATWSGCCVQV